uniref:Putative secreted protein n=1 Tax=Anopheles triannulatus TaxID=58253 RepID=A0A2M4B6L8_9DIPT
MLWLRTLWPISVLTVSGHARSSPWEGVQNTHPNVSSDEQQWSNRRRGESPVLSAQEYGPVWSERCAAARTTLHRRTQSRSMSVAGIVFLDLPLAADTTVP